MSEQPVLPYGRQWIEEEEIEAVAQVLRSDWLTTGPMVSRFEEGLRRATGAAHALAISNGTAALHAAYAALGVGPGDEVIVPAQTFSATANAARYLGATVRFADVDETLTMDVESAAGLVNAQTKVIAPVDFTGHVADMGRLRELADAHGLKLVEDAAHSLGAAYRGRAVGTLAELTTLSFHPVKIITTAEGGAVLTNDSALAERVGRFRTHGIVRGQLCGDADAGGWAYDIEEIGYNYRLTDVQSALGVVQLSRLGVWIERRQQIAAMYKSLLSGIDDLELPHVAEWCTSHAWHLFVIRVPAGLRRRVFDGLRERKLSPQVHYIPVNMLTAYQRLGYRPDQTPRALEAYDRMISIPCYPKMTDDDVGRAAEAVREALAEAKAR